MNASESMAAEFLAISANAYAAYAANRLLEKHPAIQEQFGDTAFRDWKGHFQQRILELAAALSENEPKLFVSRVNWAGIAFRARKLSQDLLQQSLQCLREVLDEELPASSKSAPLSFIDTALQSLESPEDSRPDQESGSANQIDPNTKLALQYLQTVLEGGSRQAIQLVLDAVEQGLPVRDAYEQVLLAAQREVGRMWHQAEISVAEEHYVTSTTKRAMSVLCHQEKTEPANGLTVVAAAVAQNPHDIGIRALSDFFELAGWRVVCLGSDTPPAEVAEAVKSFDADLALLSAALSTQLQTVRTTIQAIRDLESKCKIMVGGMAFLDAPDIWQQVGADGYAATLSDALTTGSRLVSTG